MKLEIGEPSTRYKSIYGDFWSPVDKKIVTLLGKHVNRGDSVHEIGFGSGHYLAYINDWGINVSGTEIRKDAYKSVKEKFVEKYPDIKLYNKDALTLSQHFDFVYSTGLIQCLKRDERRTFIRHISNISNKVMYTVPMILNDRNIGSVTRTGISGCEEYSTGNIAYELSKIYSYVETGVWDKNEILLKDDFIWFYCDMKRIDNNGQ